MLAHLIHNQENAKQDSDTILDPFNWQKLRNWTKPVLEKMGVNKNHRHYWGEWTPAQLLGKPFSIM